MDANEESMRYISSEELEKKGNASMIGYVSLMRRVLAVNLLLVLLMSAAASRVAHASKNHRAFAGLSTRLSEQGGYFDSDNLISNETSFLHVLGKMREIGVSGGVYVGVGPDQNFTYIAKVRPRMAIMIDIRRDNLLQHLWFKSLFSRARNRGEYLALLFGKPAPKTKMLDQATIKELVDYLDNTQSDPKLFEKTLKDVRSDVQKFGIPVTSSELDNIARIQKAFYSAGLDIRYSSHHRPPRSIYPAYRELLFARDLSGQLNHYLNSEEDFQFLKKLQADDLVVPVVGDLSGPQALKAIGKYITDMKERVSAFYVSNVEFYLWRQGSYDRFIENVKALPIDSRSVIIRSYFNYYAPPHPQAEPDHFSTQLLERIEDLLKLCDSGECESYNDVVTKGSIMLR